jgi:Kef-type K+ transport system membrane component KefB
MSSSTPASAPTGTKWSGAVLTALFLVVAVILFYLIYIAFPSNQHFDGLLWIGVLALVFAIVCYLAESFSRDPSAQRSLAWAFFGLGFAVLFLTLALAPAYGVSLGAWQWIGLLLTTVALAVAIALVAWRVRALQSTRVREAQREEWRERPAPSAFSYAAANSPSVPATAAPPSSPSGGSAPPRGP